MELEFLRQAVVAGVMGEKLSSSSSAKTQDMSIWEQSSWAAAFGARRARFVLVGFGMETGRAEGRG
jgi:hypothetical protein